LEKSRFVILNIAEIKVCSLQFLGSPSPLGRVPFWSIFEGPRGEGRQGKRWPGARSVGEGPGKRGYKSSFADNCSILRYML